MPRGPGPPALLLVLWSAVGSAQAATCENSRDAEVSLLQLHEKPLASCLSFIHIPKTGGLSMEVARLNAAGIKAPEGKPCGDKISAIRQGHQDLAPLKNYSFAGFSALSTGAEVTAGKLGIGRFWGACDDLLRCSYPEGTGGGRCFPGTPDGTLMQTALGLKPHLRASCSKWHVPPGLDPDMAQSLTENCDAFVVVREPMERVMSEFNWLRKACCSPECLEDFVRASLTAQPENNDCHFMPQVYYAFEHGDYKTGKRIARHVLKMHNLTDEFPALMARYGYHDVQLGEHKHPGRHCEVTPTKATEDLVRTYYAADYEAFGF